MSWKEVLPGEAEQMLNAEKVRCVDVREPDEYADGHIGCGECPLSELPERSGEIDPAQAWIVVCQAGGRSASVPIFGCSRLYTAAQSVRRHE